MTKRKAVTISVTHAEFDAIQNAFGEYFNNGEYAGEEYANYANEDGKHFSSFEQKYWRAVHTQQRRDVIKKALKEARKSQS